VTRWHAPQDATRDGTDTSLRAAADASEPVTAGPPEPGRRSSRDDPYRLPSGRPARRGGQKELPSASVGYTYLSYMIGGMLLYGGIGWLVGHFTHLPVLLPVGLLVGLALSVAMIIFRVTRS
jgi:ATP synthase protein I